MTKSRPSGVRAEIPRCDNSISAPDRPPSIVSLNTPPEKTGSGIIVYGYRGRRPARQAIHESHQPLRSAFRATDPGGLGGVLGLHLLAVPLEGLAGTDADDARQDDLRQLAADVEVGE